MSTTFSSSESTAKSLPLGYAHDKHLQVASNSTYFEVDQKESGSLTPGPPSTPNSNISIDRLREVFDQFDYSKSGTLNLSEFSSACFCIIGKERLKNMDIVQAFINIDFDKNEVISFEEFCEFIHPGDDETSTTNDVSAAFALTFIDSKHQNSEKDVSSKPSQHKFNDDYISRFWSNDLGVAFEQGINGINVYIKWRFTDYARTHIECGSKIIAINDQMMDGLPFDDIIGHLNSAHISNDGLLIKFKPAFKLENDRYFPHDLLVNDDEIEDSELLKQKFDKKRNRRKTMRKLLATNDTTIDPSKTYEESTFDPMSTTHCGTPNEHTDDELFEKIEKCKVPNCWHRFPKSVWKLFRIRDVCSIRELKRYSTHCRHCPLKRQKYKTFLHNLFDNEKYSKWSYYIQVFVMIMIIISTLAYIIETLPVFRTNPDAVIVFNWIEYIVSIIFTIEYFLRIVCSRNICVFFWDFLNLIDFVAIIPFWIELLSGAEGSNALRVIRVIRLARVFRLMKSPRFAEYMEILQRTIIQSVGSFGMFITLIFLEIIICSSLVYVCEQSDPETKFISIPATSWWAFVTVTTVGYGDMVPQSVFGRIVCVFTLFSGLLVIALPVIIIGGNFGMEYERYITRKNGWSFRKLDPDKSEKQKQKICTVARLLHFINHSLEMDIFEWSDVKALCSEGLDSFEIINCVLLYEHSYCYLPSELSSYKKYLLYDYYGKKLRMRSKLNETKTNESEYFELNGRRTQSQPPPNTKDVQRNYLRHRKNNDEDEEKLAEEIMMTLNPHKAAGS